MGKEKRTPTIASLTEQYPYPIRNLELIGLRLKKGATVAITVERAEDSDDVSVGLSLDKGDREQSVTFEDAVTLTNIPSVDISTATIAEAVHDVAVGFTMAEITKQIFAAALSETAEVVLEFDDRGESADDCWVEMSITAGSLVVSHVVPFTRVSFALSKEREEDDDEHDTDDDVGD